MRDTNTVAIVMLAITAAVLGGLLVGALYTSAAHPENGAFLLTLPPAWGSSAFFIARLRREA